MPIKLFKDICVIGAGVNGLSTAIILQGLGYSVTIITKDDPINIAARSHFASAFPSASIIPHSVYSKDLLSLFKESSSYFKKLHQQHFPGLTIKEHYELFSNMTNLPDYVNFMSNAEAFDDFKNGWYPKHPDHEISSGWRFNCFFAEWNIYYPALLKEFIDNGGSITFQELQSVDLYHLPWQIIINCSGIGSIHLFDDPDNLVYRGHLIHMKKRPMLRKPDSDIAVSYNISPAVEIFSNQGKAIDVYCYSRSDGWILGGSRQKGSIDNRDSWIGQENNIPTEWIQNVEIPRYILDLNKEIIEHSFRQTFSSGDAIEAKVGYRYIRSEKNGLRLETEMLSDKMVVHNYGHGGAGVSLSWGCALKVSSLVDQLVKYGS